MVERLVHGAMFFLTIPNLAPLLFLTFAWFRLSDYELG